jgi:pyrroline-5-carboxylate reductase
LGSAILAQRSPDDISVLREKVTSPKGTTEAALISFNNNHLEETIKQAIKAANDRSVQLSKDYS